MSTFLVVGDIHWALSPPGSRKDDYADCLRAKLREIFTEIVPKYEVDFIVCTGDIFHKKGCRLSYVDLVEMAHLLKESPVPFYSIFGNHDCPTGSSVNTPYSLLEETGALTSLSSLCWKNWIIKGMDWSYERQADVEQYNASADVIISHAFLVRDPLWTGNQEALVLFDDVFRAKPGAKLIFNGHLHHIDVGSNTFTTICNVGSLGRTAMDQDHSPSVWVVDSLLNVKQIQLGSVKPYNEVFLEKKEAPMTKIKEAVEAFRTSNLQGGKTETWREAVAAWPPSIRELANEYIRKASIDSA